MSRGLGRIERAIVDVLEDEGANPHRYATAEDLAREVYPAKKWLTRAKRRAQVVAVLRAMHSLTRKYPNRFFLTGGKGRHPLWITRLPLGRERKQATNAPNTAAAAVRSRTLLRTRR
jgi:hypothetical protein